MSARDNQRRGEGGRKPGAFTPVKRAARQFGLQIDAHIYTERENVAKHTARRRRCPLSRRIHVL